MGNNEGYEDNLKGLFSGTESEHNALKNKLIKIMSPNKNEVCCDEDDMMQEEEEALH